jgi:hypothetical protein
VNFDENDLKVAVACPGFKLIAKWAITFC